MTKAPERWVSRSGSPRPAPSAVKAWSRAIVSASFSGEGCAGSSSENCTSRAGTGSAVTPRAVAASPGGWASRSSSSRVRQVRASPVGRAGRRVRRWVRPEARVSSRVSAGRLLSAGRERRARASRGRGRGGRTGARGRPPPSRARDGPGTTRAGGWARGGPGRGRGPGARAAGLRARGAPRGRWGEGPGGRRCGAGPSGGRGRGGRVRGRAAREGQGGHRRGFASRGHDAEAGARAGQARAVVRVKARATWGSIRHARAASRMARPGSRGPGRCGRGPRGRAAPAVVALRFDARGEGPAQLEEGPDAGKGKGRVHASVHARRFLWVPLQIVCSAKVAWRRA